MARRNFPCRRARCLTTRAVSISEPARALATAAAVRLGWALTREPAGNDIARLRPEEIAAALRPRGFDVLRSERCAMYYKHRPGRLFGCLSRPGLFQAAVLAWRLANVLIGRWGNKLSVVASRAQ